METRDFYAPRCEQSREEERPLRRVIPSLPTCPYTPVCLPYTPVCLPYTPLMPVMTERAIIDKRAVMTERAIIDRIARFDRRSHY